MALKRITPFGVDLHDVDFGPGREILAKRFERCRRRCIRRRTNVEHMRQWVLLQHFERGAEAGVRLEFLERFVRRNQRDIRDATALARARCKLLRLRERDIRFQVNRQVDRVPEVSRGYACVRDEQLQAHRQGERHCHDEQR
jgi:hypothetical protein